MGRKLSTPFGAFEIPDFGKIKAFKIKLEGHARPRCVTKEVLTELQASGENVEVLYETEVGFISYQGNTYYLELVRFITKV